MTRPMRSGRSWLPFCLHVRPRVVRRSGRNDSSSTGSGSARRGVPADYAPWRTIYGLFRRWQRDGTGDRILATLQPTADAAGRIGWTVSVDSTTSRAHQHAAGAPRNGDLQKQPPGGVHDEPADHGLGRSRGS